MGFPFTPATIIEEHHGYLAAKARLDAYAAALREVVRPGAAVLDLGAGTGILGFLALKAGAGRVVAVDGSAMAGVARRLLHANGCASRATVVRGWSREIELPREFDVVVCDQLNPFALGAGLVDSLADAKERFLVPGGVLVPGSITFEVAPVENALVWDRVGLWKGAPAGYALEEAWNHARSARFHVEAEEGDLLGPPAAVAELELGRVPEGPLRGAVDLPVARKGTLHGILGWFRARLSPSVELTSSPLDPLRIRRRMQVLLPVDAPVPVEPGDIVRAELRIDPVEEQVAWGVEVRGPGDGKPRFRSDHSDFQGALVEASDLRRLAPDHVPKLTERGRAMRRALDLCASGATVEAMRGTLAWEFPGLLRRPRDVQELVQEILGRFSGD